MKNVMNAIKAAVAIAVTSLCVAQPAVANQLYSGYIADGLVAWYKFDGNANDSSGNGRNLSGSAATWTTDRTGSASSAANVSGSGYLTPSSWYEVEDSMTISAWVKPNENITLSSEGCPGVSALKGAVIYPSHGGGTGYAGQGLFVGKNGVIVGEHADNYHPVTLSYAVDLSSGWHLVSVTISNNGAPVLYVDGVCVKTGNTTSKDKFIGQSRVTASNCDSSFIGGGRIYYYNGALDDVRIYNRALSAAEVAALYSENNGLFTVTQYNFNSSCSSLSTAEAYIADSSKWSGTPTTKAYATIAFEGQSNYGSSSLHFPFVTVPFPAHSSTSEHTDYIAVVANAKIYIPEAGSWTFDCGHDDGFRVTISGYGSTYTFQDDRETSYVHTTRTFNVAAAGIYDVAMLYYEIEGGSVWDFSVAKGAYSSFSSSAFKLVGAADSPIQLAGEYVSSLATALNTTQAITTGGDASWFSQTSETYDGVSAARSGAVSDSGGSSYMETTVVGPAEVSFWWKVSSKYSYDWLSLVIDGTTQYSISGNSTDGYYFRTADGTRDTTTYTGGWQKRVFSVGSGSHVIRWQYSKDGSDFGGSDCGWVDRLVVNAGPYIVRYHKNDGSGTTATQSIDVGTTTALKWLNGGLGWYYTGYNFLGWALSASSTTVAYANGQSVTDLASSGETVDLYAVLEPTTYTVRYNKNDGSGTTTSQVFTRGATARLKYMDSQIGWKVAGHSFGGWATSAGSTTVAYANGASVNNIAAAGATRDLYAIWRPTIAAAKALDVSGRTFTFGGKALWFGQTAVSYAGGSAMQSGAIGANQETYMETTVTGPAEVSFWWKVASEPGCDYLDFYVDGTRQNSISGTGGAWTLYTVSVPTGTHTLRWLYHKDSGGDVSPDCGWVDQLSVKYGPYQVTYHKNDGTSATVSQAFETGVTQNLLWMDSQIGWKYAYHTFLGWSTSASATTVSYANGQRVTNLTSYGNTADLYAVWRFNGYMVRYNRNFGEAAQVTQEIPRDVTQNLKWMDSQIGWKRTGYTFQGWARSASAKTAAYTNGQSVKNLGAIGATVDLHAVWKPITYTVRFHKNDGTSATKDQTFTYDVAQILLWQSSGLKWTVSGCTFGGWSRTATGAVAYANGQRVTNLASTQSAVVHLYGVWNYTVTMKRNTSTGDTACSTVTCRYGSTASLPWMDSALKWKRTGYVFGGWSTTANGAALYANGGKATGVKSSATLYAKWNPIKYTVRFHRRLTASDTTTRDQTHTYDQELNLLYKDSQLKWTNAGFDFLGWATTTNATTATYANGQKVKNLASTQGAVVKLYALWLGQPYTVRLNKNDGTSTKVSRTFRYHTAQCLPYKDGELHWSRTGYTFLGWARTAGATKAEFANGQRVTDLAAIGKTIDLYAVWQANVYTIVLNYNDGRSDLIREISAQYGQDMQLPWGQSGLKWIPRTGKTFVGWSTAADATTATYQNGAKVKNLTATNGGTVELYAVWK